uniref:Uncharacterized protein n=1 Tax=Eutreptiella gymnastica TaxID=73025 RepID=A0A7S4FN31_9EUGL
MEYVFMCQQRVDSVPFAAQELPPDISTTTMDHVEQYMRALLLCLNGMEQVLHADHEPTCQYCQALDLSDIASWLLSPSCIVVMEELQKSMSQDSLSSARDSTTCRGHIGGHSGPLLGCSLTAAQLSSQRLISFQATGPKAAVQRYEWVFNCTVSPFVAPTCSRDPPAALDTEIDRCGKVQDFVAECRHGLSAAFGMPVPEPRSLLLQELWHSIIQCNATDATCIGHYSLCREGWLDAQGAEGAAVWKVTDCEEGPCHLTVQYATVTQRSHLVGLNADKFLHTFEPTGTCYEFRESAQIHSMLKAGENLVTIATQGQSGVNIRGVTILQPRYYGVLRTPACDDFDRFPAPT